MLYTDDPSLTSKQRKRFEDPEIRDVFLVKTDEEVRTTIFNAVSSIKTPIKGKKSALSSTGAILYKEKPSALLSSISTFKCIFQFYVGKCIISGLSNDF